LQTEGGHADGLSERAECSVESVLGALGVLEILGFVVREPTGAYRALAEAPGASAVSAPCPKPKRTSRRSPSSEQD
jgi:hypothetical protein